MLADLLGSVGVIVSATLIMAFNWQIADPILSVIIALLIVFNTRKLIVTILNVLLQGDPEHIDVYQLCKAVIVIHDVHIWTITSGNEVFSAHILMDPSYQGDLDQMTTRMQNLLHDRYSIGHVTCNWSGRWRAAPKTTTSATCWPTLVRDTLNKSGSDG